MQVSSSKLIGDVREMKMAIVVLFNDRTTILESEYRIALTFGMMAAIHKTIITFFVLSSCESGRGIRTDCHARYLRSQATLALAGRHLTAFLRTSICTHGIVSPE